MTGQPLAGGRRRGRGWGGGGAHRGGRVGGGRGRPFGNGAPQPSPSKHSLLFFFCSSSQALHSTHHGWRCVSRRGGGHDPLHPSHACSALGVCGRSKLNRPHAALSRRTTALPRLCPPPRSRSPLLSPTPTPPGNAQKTAMARQTRLAELKKAGAGEGGADGKRGESARPRRESAPAGAAPRSLPRPSPWPSSGLRRTRRAPCPHTAHTQTPRIHTPSSFSLCHPPPPCSPFSQAPRPRPTRLPRPSSARCAGRPLCAPPPGPRSPTTPPTSTPSTRLSSASLASRTEGGPRPGRAGP